MKFKITRSSFHGGDEKPCDESFLLKEEEYESRDKDGNVWREFTIKTWAIEIDTLDELMNLIDKYDDIIVRKINDAGEEEPTIEIYDDYRE